MFIIVFDNIVGGSAMTKQLNVQPSGEKAEKHSVLLTLTLNFYNDT